MNELFPFIALEGTDGSGKSTLRVRLAQELRNRGFRVTELGQHSWLDAQAARVIAGTRFSRSLLDADEVVRAYIQDKVMHYRHNVRPALGAGFVLADRYVLSDIVYHQVLHGADRETICAAMRAQRLTAPDLIVLVDTPPATAWERIQGRGQQLRPYERPANIAALYDAYARAVDDHVVDAEIIRFPNAGDLTAAKVAALADGVISLREAA